MRSKCFVMWTSTRGQLSDWYSHHRQVFFEAAPEPLELRPKSWKVPPDSSLSHLRHFNFREVWKEYALETILAW